MSKTKEMISSTDGLKNFRRSLKYLLPYKGRLTVAVICVIIISFLWGGGLGMILPATKVLLSQEGLHGWVWNTVCDDKLDARVIQQKVPAGIKIDETELSFVLTFTQLEDGGRAQKGGIKDGEWVIGLVENGKKSIIRADVLARTLAQAPEKVTLDLLIYTPYTKETRQMPFAMGSTSYKSHLLTKVATILTEPATFRDRFDLFMTIAMVILGITLLRCSFEFIQEYMVGTAIWQGIMDLRNDNYNVVLQLPLTYFSEKGVSDATSRFIADTGELARGQNTLLGKTLVEPGKAIACFAVAMALSWELTLMATIAGPLAFYIIRRMGKSMHKASKRSLEHWSAIISVLNQTLIGIRVVKAYTMEVAERKRFFRVNTDLYRQLAKMERLDAMTGPSVETLGMAAGMAAIGVAGYRVFNGTMDPEIFMTWIGSLFAIFDPVRKLAKVTMRFQQSDAAAKRIFELQDTPVQKSVPGAPSLPRHAKDIEFRCINFRYPNTQVDTLKEINLTVKHGQTVAVVGPNGSGKTTLLSLLPRLIDPSTGKILIDGNDIATHSIRSLRRQIGLVTQETVLFNTTIADNISYGLHRPNREKVIEVARKAFVDEFVQEMPNKYDTMVGEYGTTLSGGQKQRISIARAMLRDPAILIFDEAMSQIDSDSERRIQEAMSTFVKGRTTLLIAHRFATVLSADKIVVMDGGRILDCGTHDELVNRCQLYNHLYTTQFLDSGGTQAK